MNHRAVLILAIEDYNNKYCHPPYHLYIWKMFLSFMSFAIFIPLLVFLFLFLFLEIQDMVNTVMNVDYLTAIDYVITKISIGTLILFVFGSAAYVLIRTQHSKKRLLKPPDYGTDIEPLDGLKLLIPTNFIHRVKEFLFDLISINIIAIENDNNHFFKQPIKLDKNQLDLAEYIIENTENNKVIKFGSLLQNKEINKCSVDETKKVLEILKELKMVQIYDTEAGRTIVKRTRMEMGLP